jgi:hypothetical protein
MEEKIMLKYFFYIIDNEVNMEYTFEGYFYDHFEAYEFIKDNENVGNVVTIIKPYYIHINENEVIK